ncbi:MAG: hypothetical protein LBK56_07215, partial [Gracilibacteraceae bacterium]|nr:hypothetical protein [Gracilibacteraceae bacterium]
MTGTRIKTQNFDAAWISERSEYFAGIYDDLLNLRQQGVLQDKRIALVGAWNNAGEIRTIIKRLGLDISCIADNNPSKQGVSRLGIISQSVESLRKEKDLIILVANNYYWKDIQKQLLGVGFIERKDFFIVFGGEKHQRLSQTISERLLLNEIDWRNYTVRARLGYESYRLINEKYSGLLIWLMHQPSLGDLYIFSLFLPIAMNVSTIAECECVLIVTKNTVRKLAETLGFKHIELITFDDANMNWLMLMKLMGEHLNIRNAVYHGQNSIFQTLVHYSKVSFRDSFTKYVFQFPGEVKPIYPKFPKRTKYVLSQFREYELTPSNTVLISPYAGHFNAEISASQWQRLVNGLKTKGYAVCTNCGSAEETPLPGTAAPFIELRDCVEFVETAGHFIGVRSGFCDLICMAKCQKIIIYETGAPAASIEYFGFESMGVGDDNITEVINDCI